MKIGIAEISTISRTAGSRYVSIFSGGIRSLICLARAQPASRMPSVHRMPPTTFHRKNCLADMPMVPATGLRKVRTIGMNRASTTAFAGPNFTK
ncbi:hypothetical protein [Dactylosporangium cerinum]